ncbi:hypothetical protein Ancab_023022 [Ancistrocladus abbreviatus]
MLVKGSLYTGTDDGAVNLIKTDDGSEIIDLMGAPGALIPPEVPRGLLLDTALGARALSDTSESVNKLSLVLNIVTEIQVASPDIFEIPEACSSTVEEARSIDCQPKEPSEIFVQSNPSDKSGHESGQLFPSEYRSIEVSPGSEESLLAQEQKVKDVSKYVISAAKNPEFAQKLHAVLVECGTSPPADLFSDITRDIYSEQKLCKQIQSEKGEDMDFRTSCNPGKYWSNSELSLLPPSGGRPFGYDDTLGLAVMDSTGHQLELIPLCCESNNEGIQLVTSEANKMNLTGAIIDPSNGMIGHGAKFLNRIETERICCHIDGNSPMEPPSMQCVY